MKKLSKIYNTDTNLYVNNIKLITDLAKDADNLVIEIPEIIVSEIDNRKKNPKDKKSIPKFSLASKFLETLVDISEEKKSEDIGLTLPNLEQTIKVVDFSNESTLEKMNQFFEENYLIKENPKGKIAILGINQILSPNNYFSEKTEESEQNLSSQFTSRFSKFWNYRINIGDNDTLLIETTRVLAKHNPHAKIVASDTNLRTAANINFKGLAEKPKGLKEPIYDMLPRGYHFANWGDVFSDKFINKIMSEMPQSNKGLYFTLSDVNTEFLKLLRTQDYLIMLGDGESERDFKTQIEKKDNNRIYEGIPKYMLPNFSQVFKYCEEKIGVYKLLPLDQRITKSDDITTIFSGFEPRSFESLLFMDAMLRNINLHVGYGAKGTGKSYTAIYTALSKIGRMRNSGMKTHKTPKLLLNKPLAEMGEPVGYLPGSLESKMLPTLNSAISAYEKIARLGGPNNFRPTFAEALKGHVGKFKNEPLIKLIGINYIQGDDVSKGEILFSDEVQNYSVKLISELLSRQGTGDYILTGDPGQTIKEGLNHRENGMTATLLNIAKKMDYDHDDFDKLNADLALLNNISVIRFENKIRTKDYAQKEARFWS